MLKIVFLFISGGGFGRGTGDRGGFRGRGGASRGDRGRPAHAETEPVFREIQDGLQLWVIYKKVPTLEETTKQYPGFHSRSTRPTGKDSSSTAHILLFTDIESLEAAKVKLDKDDNVESTDYMGFRSAKKQVCLMIIYNFLASLIYKSSTFLSLFRRIAWRIDKSTWSLRPFRTKMTLKSWTQGL